MFSDKPCPVCASEFTCDLQAVYLQRQRARTTQRYCMDCQSFFHQSGYKEDDQALVADVGWLVAHPGDFGGLIAGVRELFPAARTCFEAGCGVGHFLAQLAAAGYRARGIDVNAHAVRVAREKYKVDAEAGPFREGLARADLVFAIDVLEHLEAPRTFFAAMLASLMPGGGVVVRVPYVARDRWCYLRGADGPKAHEAADPFLDNSVHITHFSPLGLRLMAEGLGAELVDRLGPHKDCFVFGRVGHEGGRRARPAGPVKLFARLRERAKWLARPARR